MEDRAFRNLLELCADPTVHRSLVLITSRVPLTDIHALDGHSYRSLRVDFFSERDGAEYLRGRGIKGDTTELLRLSGECGGHALSLSVLAGFLNEYFGGRAQGASETPSSVVRGHSKVNQILRAYDSRLSDAQRAFMQVLSAIRRPITLQTFEAIVVHPEFAAANPLLKTLSDLDSFSLRNMIGNLEQRGLIIRDTDDQDNAFYSSHPIIREYFYGQLSADPKLRRLVNLQLRDFVSELQAPDRPTRLSDLVPVFDSIFYGCRAELYDTAAKEIYTKWVKVDRWEIGYLFGVYELELSLLCEFFLDRSLAKRLLVTDDAARSFLITEVGYAFYKLGRHSDAIAFWDRAILAYGDQLDHKTLAIVNYGIAQARATMGELTKAYAAAENGLEFSRLSGTLLWESNSLATLGWLAFLRGEFHLAEQSYQQANSLARRSEEPDELGLFSVLGVEYATFLLATGRKAESQNHTEHNLDVCTKRGWQESLVHCERLLGDTALVSNRTEVASQHYATALELARDFGVQEQLTLVLLGIARVLAVQGEYEEASMNLTSALKITDQFGYVIPKADIYNQQADMCLNTHQLEDAKELAKKALEVGETTGYAWGKAAALHTLGKIAVASGDMDRARGYLKDALEIRQRICDANAVLTQELFIGLD